jgi:hypothetical protein
MFHFYTHSFFPDYFYLSDELDTNSPIKEAITRFSFTTNTLLFPLFYDSDYNVGSRTLLTMTVGSFCDTCVKRVD